MSQYDDAQSQRAVEELTEKIESKKKGRQFDIEGINNAIMEEHTTEGHPNIADQFRQQEKNLKSKWSQSQVYKLKILRILKFIEEWLY